MKQIKKISTFLHDKNQNEDFVCRSFTSFFDCFVVLHFLHLKESSQFVFLSLAASLNVLFGCLGVSHVIGRAAYCSNDAHGV